MPKDIMQKNYAIYKRVSTLEQAQDGNSLQAQEVKLTQYCTALSHNIVGIYSDDGYSGSSTNRPALQNLIRDIENGKIDAVAIYKLDRLSRKVKDVLELVELFEKYNVTLFSLNENIDLASPFGRAALKIAATFSEFERENIIERTAMGRKQRSKNGYMTTGCNKCTFGYRYDKETKSFIVKPDEAEIIKDIFDVYINQHFALRKVSEYCYDKYGLAKFKNNLMSCKELIHRIMYAGYFYYQGEIIKGANFEPIISLDTYFKAQAIAENNYSKRSTDNTQYPLTGLIYCAQCGSRFYGKRRKYYTEKNGKKTLKYEYLSYGCGARIKRDKNQQPCHNDTFPATKLEDYVINAAKNINVNTLNYNNDKNISIEKLIEQNRELTIKKERLLDLYMENIIDKDNLNERTIQFNKEIEKNILLVAEQKNNIINQPTHSIDNIIEQQNMLENMSRYDQRKFLTSIIKSIVIDGKLIKINWQIQ